MPVGVDDSGGAAENGGRAMVDESFEMAGRKAGTPRSESPGLEVACESPWPAGNGGFEAGSSGLRRLNTVAPGLRRRPPYHGRADRNSPAARAIG
jgi:hypothetical protein